MWQSPNKRGDCFTHLHLHLAHDARKCRCDMRVKVNALRGRNSPFNAREAERQGYNNIHPNERAMNSFRRILR